MKYLFLSLLAVTILGFSSCSGKKGNEDIFTEFEGDKGVYMVKLPPALFMNLIGMEKSNIDTEAMGNIKLVKLLIYSRENDTDSERADMYGKISGKLADYEYENLIGFNSGKVFISAYVLENVDYISDLMIVFRENESLACLGLSGRLKGDEIMQFASEIEYNRLRDFVNGH
ncbi:MAG: DUF4252 domain-containing protein [Bacteroidales bacterium]|jgi:hypothetical protein|nr:DUF4252 domain-containing protein [Bacteroidales bacterium]